MKKIVFFLGYCVLYFLSFYALVLTFWLIDSNFELDIFKYAEPFTYIILSIIFFYIFRKKYKNSRITKTMFAVTFIFLLILFFPFVTKKCGRTNFDGSRFIDSGYSTFLNRILEINIVCSKGLYY